ncbi:uncharacterized protein LOC131018835 [Salvia miltiorrhiza]|uniref:uncharacterized protein LOC131018835 n=1 Tax=Salvia miltiorrhiza TaxID=226208 RepID=UPI0025ABFBF2|nr:uncharacterized protein LOC131018835 [Salvia miltiorrhiza]
MIITDTKGDWRFTGFYGFPERGRRRESWNLLRRLAVINSLPWVIAGDFNDLLDPGDKRGRVDHPNWLFSGFRSAIMDCGLSDIPLTGHQYTWSRGLGTAHSVEERLDPGMATSAWKLLYPDAILMPLSVPISDHAPLLLRCKEKLTVVSESISIWAAHLTRHDRLAKSRLQIQIANIQGHTDLQSIKKLKHARQALANILLKEETHWRQRAKQHWLQEGDCNTKFFHTMASARRKKNSIVRLQRDDGSWTENVDDIKLVARSYFENLFDESNAVTDFHHVLDRLSPGIDEAMNEELTKPFTLDEFKAAVFQMHPDKSPGPDGFNPNFYQNCWDVVGVEVFHSCCTWLENESFPPGLNHTMVSLIPKVDVPSNMKELRPIALCNVIYKILSKVLCNRLKKVLPGLIDRSQSAFVEGRLIQDNILIAFEAIHSMKKKTRGKHGFFALKIDISKAYDRVDWNYLDAILSRFGFCAKWRAWMKMCVGTVSYDILVNGDPVGPIIPGRGLRQGDPLSPYLFIFRASEMECSVLKSVLGAYESASGQAINFQKSGVFFSSNVDAGTRDTISHSLGVYSPLNTGRYLGLPSLIGRKKKEIFQYLRDRLWNRIQGWNGKKLSKAGKKILIKGVAQAIPSFCMSIFSLPIGLMDELERMMNSFWWGNKGGVGKGINWLKWERLCVDKKLGGLGFRSLQLLNIAMLGKTRWRLIDEPEALVCKVLKAKYFPRGDFLTAKVGHNPSYAWRSICSAQDIVRRGVRWRIEDGSRVRVFEDPWLRKDDSFFVASPCPPDCAGIKVKELINFDSGTWNRELLHELVEGQWASLWKLKVPPKVRNFLWRAGRNNLPTKDKLFSRGITVGGECVLCRTGFENLWHLFFQCPFADECWRISNLQPLIEAVVDSCKSFSEAHFKIMGGSVEETTARICMTLWQIWKDRNTVVWKNATLSPANSILQAAHARAEWLLAWSRRPQRNSQPEAATICKGWHPLPLGNVKCDVDAAFFKDDYSMGIWLVLRDHEGAYILGKSVKMLGLRSVEEGELIGIKEALSWLKDLGYTCGWIDSDSKRACDAVSSGERNITELGVIVALCRADLLLSPDIRLRHIRRNQNTIAHCLAKAARDITTQHVWNEPPTFVVGHLHVPCSCD